MKHLHCILSIVGKAFLLILVACLLGLFAGCRSSNASTDSDRAEAELAAANAAEVKDFEEDESELVSLPANIKTNLYYYGKIENQEYILIFNNIEKKKFSGTFYKIGENAMVSPVDFSGKAKREKCLLVVNGKKTVWKKYRASADDYSFKGSFTEGKTVKEFSFSTYIEPTFKKSTDSSRYQDEYFEVEVINDVKYGSAEGYWVSREENSTNYAKIIASGIAQTLSQKQFDLRMDLYLPKNDSQEKRPLIMFIHGGGFYIGDKKDNPIVLWCRHYAKMGYVVASINYRMGFKPTKGSIERCGYCATQDAAAAMRYLVHNKEKFRIDPNYLFVAGSSAGGITTLNLAFMRNKNRPESSKKSFGNEDLGAIESSGNTLKETYKIRCICNMWGAVHDISMIDNANISIVSFHGNADQVVPYGEEVPFKDIKLGIGKLFFNKMFGSKPIHARAKTLGYRQQLYTFDGCGHAPHVDKNNQPNDKFYFIQEKTTDFFYKEFVPEEPSINYKDNQTFTAVAGDFAQCYWQVTGGFILEQNRETVRVVWMSDAKEKKLEMSGTLLNGAVVNAVYAPAK